MAWERGLYYTRSKKVRGRVVREYIGGGVAGERAAAEDARHRAARAEEKAAWRRRLAELEAMDAALAELNALADLAARACLAAAGYHQHHRGAWRKRACRT